MSSTLKSPRKKQPQARRKTTRAAAARKSSVAVEIRAEVADVSPVMLNWLKKFSTRACHLAGFSAGALDVLIVDDKTMAKLHKQYKNVGGTTDVLTFDLREQGSTTDEPLEGDLVICLDEAGRQASDRGHDVGQELMLYIVHGILHLAGHDDLSPKKAALMHQRENEILTELGLGAVFGSVAIAEAKS